MNTPTKISLIVASIALVWVSRARSRVTQQQGSPPEVAGSREPFGVCEKKGREGEKTVWIGLGTLEYCDGRRGLPFVWERRPKPEPEVLFVPSASRWPKTFPSWSHARREEILGDIRRMTLERGYEFRFVEFD